MSVFLTIQIIGGPLPLILLLLSLALLLYLVAAPIAQGRLVPILGAVLIGVVIAVGVFFWGDATGAFGVSLPLPILWWTAATCAAIGVAIVNLWNSRWWRKVLASVGVVVFAVTGAVQVNAVFGLDPTIGDLLGIVVDDPITLPPLPATQSGAPDRPLHETWVPPSDIPASGAIGTAEIPAVAANFEPRPAGIYLPPAALVKDAPALPLMIFMMGYPGTPDVSRVSTVMSTFAEQHDGLAPIVIVADQLGSRGGDPACADSPERGDAETYITQDVVAWAAAHLNVIDDPAYWTIGGYSNGASCAVKYAALHPDVWSNAVAVSPEEYPGLNYSTEVIAEVYGGDTARWQADKPAALLADAQGRLSHSWAVITTGALDDTFGPGSRALAAAMKDAGIDTTLQVIPDVGHVGENLPRAQEQAYPLLYGRLGLAAPR